MSYVTPKQAADFFNVTQKTLRQWEDNAQIKAQKTKGGHRRYFVPQKTKINITFKESDKPQKETESPYILYARVSSRKQKQDLERPVKLVILRT